MRTVKLRWTALDWAVAKCVGIKFVNNGVFRPTVNWAQGGPIIEHQRITLKPAKESVTTAKGAKWVAIGCEVANEDGMRITCYGPTPLIAAMRCYVVSKLGDTEIDVPEELQ